MCIRDRVNTSSNNGLLEYDNFAIDSKFRTVKVNGQNVELTNYEFDILYLLAKNPGQVFSKEQIYSQVWKTPYYGAEDNVMSLIRRIRKKIEPNPAKPCLLYTSIVCYNKMAQKTVVERLRIAE